MELEYIQKLKTDYLSGKISKEEMLNEIDEILEV